MTSIVVPSLTLLYVQVSNEAARSRPLADMLSYVKGPMNSEDGRTGHPAQSLRPRSQRRRAPRRNQHPNLETQYLERSVMHGMIPTIWSQLALDVTLRYGSKANSGR